MGTNQTCTFGEAVTNYGVTYGTWINYNTGTSAKWGGTVNTDNVNQVIKDKGYYLIFELVEGTVQPKVRDGKLYLDDYVSIDWRDQQNPSNTFKIYNKTIVYMQNKVGYSCEYFDEMINETVNGTCYKFEPYHDTIIYDPIITVENITINSEFNDVKGDDTFTYLEIDDSPGSIYENLTGYWSFDGEAINTKLTTYFDFSKHDNDGVGVNNAAVNSTGCMDNYGNCLQINKETTDYVDLGTMALDDSQAITYSVWVKPKFGSQDPTATGYLILDIQENPNTNRMQIYWRGGDNEWRWHFWDEESGQNGGQYGIPYFAFSAGEWIHIVATKDSTYQSFYIDGVVKQDNVAHGLGIVDLSQNTIGKIGITGAVDTAWSWNGSIDEVMVFNTSLTQAQVSALYFNSSPRFKTSGTHQFLPGNITSGSTSWDSLNVTTELALNFSSVVSLYIEYLDGGSWTASPTVNITSSELSGSKNSTIFTITTGTTNVTLNYTYYPGNATFNPFYTPIMRNDITLETYTAAVVEDTIAPDNVGFLAPTPDNDTNLSQNNYFVNVSFNDSNPNLCQLELTNTSGTINYTMTQGANTSEWYLNTSHTNNMTWFTAYCKDDASNWNNSEIRHVNISTPIVVDTISPGFSDYKTNTTPNETQDIMLNVTITDSDSVIDEVHIEIKNNTHTINYTVSTNVTTAWYFVLAQGNYTAHDNITWYWFANDTGNNLNISSQQEFIVTNQAPTAPALGTPANNSNLSTTSVTFNWSLATDADVEDTITYYLFINGTLNISHANTTNWTTISFPDGSYFWNIFADDNYTNTSSLYRNFTVDTTIPTITLDSPSNSTYQNTGVTIALTVSDSYLDTIIYSIDSYSTNYTLADPWDIDTTGFSEGETLFDIWVNDSAGNMLEKQYNFTLDDTNPSIVFMQVSNSSYNRTGIGFNVSISDANLNTTLWSNDSWVTNYTAFNISTIGWAEQEQLIWVFANDSAGNYKISVLNITLDDTDPTISFVHPANGSYNNSGGTIQVSIYDINLDESYWSNDSWVTNFTTFNISTAGMADGEYNFMVFANDSANNQFVNTFNITIDDTTPNGVGFLLPTPLNDTNLSQNNYLVNVSFNDTNPDSCLLEFTGTTNYTMTQGANSSEYYRNMTGLSNGMNYFIAYCNDTAGNWNNSEIRFVNISVAVGIVISNMEAFEKGMEWMKWNWSNSASVIIVECELYEDVTRIEFFNTTLETYNRTFLTEDVEYNLTCRGYDISNVAGSWNEIIENTESILVKTIINLKILKNWISRLLGLGGLI